MVLMVLLRWTQPEVDFIELNILRFCFMAVGVHFHGSTISFTGCHGSFRPTRQG